MSAQLVFMLEEASMKALLEGLLPRILPAEIQWILIPHEGKSDLQASLKRKLAAWRDPRARFFVVRDQDNGDCRKIKRGLLNIAKSAGRSDVTVRIVCRELESWVLGDLEALEAAYGPGLAHRFSKARFRDPDRLQNPFLELRALISNYQKVTGARTVGMYMDPDRNVSTSFQVFVAAIRRAGAQEALRETLGEETLTAQALTEEAMTAETTTAETTEDT